MQVETKQVTVRQGLSLAGFYTQKRGKVMVDRGGKIKHYAFYRDCADRVSTRCGELVRGVATFIDGEFSVVVFHTDAR